MSRIWVRDSSLTPVLKKLEAKGYITRTRSKDDERNLIITITEEGENLRKKALSVPAAMGNCVCISQEEAATLYSLLYKIIGGFDDLDEE